MLSIKPEKLTSILVVCMGNICRSPMAEGVLRTRLSAAGMGHIRVSSAGTLGWDKAPARDEAVRACADIGVDITGHRSSPIAPQMAQTADLILAMEQQHIRDIADWFGSDGNKMHLLGAFHPDNPGMEIEDPYGMSAEVYRKVLKEICRCTDGFVETLAKAKT